MSRAGRDEAALPAAAAPDAELPPAPSPRAAELAGRFKMLRDLVVRVVHSFEASCMETAWLLRCEFPPGDEGEAAFVAFAHAHVGIEPETAARMAGTWAIARRQRPLREMAQKAPERTMTLVQQFVEGNLLESLEDDDPKIAQLLSLPPRRQREELGLLIEAREGDRHPDDVRRIRELEERAADRRDDAGADVNRVREAIVAVAGMADRLHEVGDALGGARVSTQNRKRMLDALERLDGAGQAIAEALLEQR